MELADNDPVADLAAELDKANEQIERLWAELGRANDRIDVLAGVLVELVERSE